MNNLEKKSNSKKILYNLNKNDIVMRNKNNIVMRNKNNRVIDNKNIDMYYLSKLSIFCKIYNVDNINDPKIEHRYFCFRYLNYIRNIELCDIKLNQSKEAVLIEFRIFPHIEFLIRNTINKLDDEWSHTVICGNLNYEFMLNLCNSISNNIKVIKLDYDNMTQSEYSNYLCTLNFWNLLYGEKILIYQEDTNIFKNNINDFLEWDYIGAPWPKIQNDTPNLVGNGGFSLRTKQCMIDVINKISLKDTKFNSSTIDFMKNVGLIFGPEDVYFSKNMHEFKIGKVADYNTAFNFSTESVYNPNSFGGHCFWYSDKNWKQRLYNLINQKNDYKSINTLLNNSKFVIIASPYYYTVGGGEKYISYIMKYYIQQNYSILFLNTSTIETFNKTKMFYFTKNEYSKIYLLNWSLLFDINFINQIKNKTDYFIYMFNFGVPQFEGLSKCNIFHCQFPFDYQNINNNFYSSWSSTKISYILNSYDKIIVISEFTLDCIQKYYINIQNNFQNQIFKKINIIYPPCIKNNNQNNNYEKTNNTFVMIGRIFKYNKEANNKFFNIAIEIFNKLNKYDYELIIIGSVKCINTYKKLYQSIINKNKIKIIANASDEQKELYLKKCKYFIQLTGIEDKYQFNNEHFGISLIESLNYNCIPICYAQGYPNYIIDTTNGYLINNKLELYNLLIHILNNNNNNNLVSIDISKYSDSEFFINLNKLLE